MITGVRLLGDVGGTNARFATYGDDGRPRGVRVVPVDDYETLREAIEAYLAAEGIGKPLRAAAFAVASPVTGDAVKLTNHPWSFSILELQRDLQVERLHVINDFTANALAVSHLRPEERQAIGGGDAVPDTPVAVLGPGTGLGVSGLIPAKGSWTALAGEGGHATMPAGDDDEADVLARLRRRYGHVSAERVLSGPGLVNLYQTLAEMAGVTAESYTPAQISDRAIGEEEPLCRNALEMFCGMLGEVAGNLALTLGARGGVYIAGGIVPRVGARFAASRFRERFEGKGRFRGYLAAVPTFVITAKEPAFLGLADILDRQP